MHKYGCEIEYEGEVLYKGWRDKVNRLWRLSLMPDATNRITPHTDPSEYDGTNGMVLGVDADIK